MAAFSPLRHILILAGLLISAPFEAATADQTQISTYAQARKLVWAKLYPERKTGTPHSDLYCGFDFRDRDDIEMQVEHVYPANWMATFLGCGSRKKCQATSDRFNRMEADLHNLWPADADANRVRSNHTFAIIPGETKSPFEDCDLEIEDREVTGAPTKKVVEPRPIARGNIARSIFYMHQEYGLPIEPRLLPLLKQWNTADPVSADERRRNVIIERLEGKRNPFIDQPSLANRL